MFENLQVFESRYEELNLKLYDPATAADRELYARLMKEHKNLSPVVEKYREYKQTQADYAEAEELLKEPLDKDFKDMVQAEFFEAKDMLARLEDELKILLLPKDEDDDKSAIVEIRAGVGGEEATLFANSLLRMYTMYAETHGYKIDILSANQTELGGVKEITFLVEGDSVYSRLKFESGTHRVQRVPETESSGRIHTSAVTVFQTCKHILGLKTVAVLPEAEEVEIEINPNDLQIETYRASGAGGQHVNKTSSAIRITHLPTGLVVECQDERSQFKNKDKAMKILRSRLYNMKQKEQADKISAERKDQVGSGDRSERIRTYNFPQGRVTDHRIGLTLYAIESFLNGGMDEMVESLITADRAEKLAQSSD